MYSKTLTHGGHTRQFEIRDAGVAGWEVREQQDDRTVRQVLYTDWHRVERAVTRLESEIASLEREGWTVRDDEAAAMTSA